MGMVPRNKDRTLEQILPQIDQSPRDWQVILGLVEVKPVRGTTSRSPEHNQFSTALQVSLSARLQKKAAREQGTLTQSQSWQWFQEIDACQQMGLTVQQGLDYALACATGAAWRQPGLGVAMLSPARNDVPDLGTFDGFQRVCTPHQTGRSKARELKDPSLQWLSGAAIQLAVFGLHRKKQFKGPNGATYEDTWAQVLRRSGSRAWYLSSGASLVQQDVISTTGLHAECDDKPRAEQDACLVEVVDLLDLEHCPTVVDSDGKSNHAFFPFEVLPDFGKVGQLEQYEEAQLLLCCLIDGDFEAIGIRQEMRCPSFWLDGSSRQQATLFLGCGPCFYDLQDALTRLRRAYCLKFQVTPDQVQVDAARRKDQAQQKKVLTDSLKAARDLLGCTTAQLKNPGRVQALIEEAQQVLESGKLDRLKSCTKALQRALTNRTERGLRNFGKTKASKHLLDLIDQAPRELQKFLKGSTLTLLGTPSGSQHGVLVKQTALCGSLCRDLGIQPPEILEAIYAEALRGLGWDVTDEDLRHVRDEFTWAAQQKSFVTEMPADGVARVEGIRYEEARVYPKQIREDLILPNLSFEQPTAPVLLVGVCCALGKTQLALHYIDQLQPEDAALVILPTQSLVSDFVARPEVQAAGFQSYMDSKGKVRKDLSGEDFKRLVLCIDSTRLVEKSPYRHRYRFTLFDEVVTDLRACLKRDTDSDPGVTRRMQETFDQVFEIFEDATRQPWAGGVPRVMCCFAVATPSTMKALRFLCGDQDPLCLVPPVGVKPYAGKKVCRIPEQDVLLHAFSFWLQGAGLFIGELTKRATETLFWIFQTVGGKGAKIRRIKIHTSTAPLREAILLEWPGQSVIIGNLTVSCGLSDIDPSRQVVFTLFGQHGYLFRSEKDWTMPSNMETALQQCNRARAAKWVFISSTDAFPDGLNFLPNRDFEAEERADYAWFITRASRDTGGRVTQAEEQKVARACRLRALVLQGLNEDKIHGPSRLVRYLVHFGAEEVQPPPLLDFTPEQEAILRKDFRDSKQWPKSEELARALKFGDLDRLKNRQKLQDFVQACHPLQDPMEALQERIATRGGVAEAHLEEHGLLWVVTLLQCCGYEEEVLQDDIDTSTQYCSPEANPYKRATRRSRVLGLLQLIDLLTAHPIDGQPYSFRARVQGLFSVDRTHTQLQVEGADLQARLFFYPQLEPQDVVPALALLDGKAPTSPDYKRIHDQAQALTTALDRVQNLSRGAICRAGKNQRVKVEGKKRYVLKVDEQKLFPWLKELDPLVPAFFGKKRQALVEAEDVPLLHDNPADLVEILEARAVEEEAAEAAFADLVERMPQQPAFDFVESLPVLQALEPEQANCAKSAKSASSHRALTYEEIRAQVETYTFTPDPPSKDLEAYALQHKLVPIDFEYQVDKVTGEPSNLICCCLLVGPQVESFWLLDGEDEGRLVQRLQELQKWGAVLVAHSVEIAEARAFLRLGLNPSEFQWLDTFLGAKQLSNCVSGSPVEVKCPEGKRDLASVTLAYTGRSRDTSSKHALQLLCGEGTKEQIFSQKSAILAYCSEDVVDCVAIVQAMESEWAGLQHKALWDNTPTDFWGCLKAFSTEAAESAVVSSRGLPVDEDALGQLIEEAPRKIQQAKAAFEQKWGCTNDKQKRAKVREEAHRLNLPDPGTLQKGDLQDLAEMGSEFVQDLLELKNLTGTLQGVAKGWGQSVQKGRVYYGGLNPFGTLTGRCTPQPKRGFIPAWSKKLHSTLWKAPEGRCLVELDYGSQEIWLAGALYRDPATLKAYSGKDFYISVLALLGLVPEEDGQLSKAAFEQKHPGLRQEYKAALLGDQYGMGATSLARKYGLEPARAVQILDSLHRLFHLKREESDRLQRQVFRSKAPSMIHLPSGWGCIVGNEQTGLTHRNFPIQGSGAAIRGRLVHRLLTEWATESRWVCATVHDAIIIECSEQEAAEAVDQAKQIMIEVAADYVAKSVGACPLQVKVGVEYLWTPSGTQAAGPQEAVQPLDPLQPLQPIAPPQPLGPVEPLVEGAEYLDQTWRLGKNRFPAPRWVPRVEIRGPKAPEWGCLQQLPDEERNAQLLFHQRHGYFPPEISPEDEEAQVDWLDCLQAVKVWGESVQDLRGALVGWYHSKTPTAFTLQPILEEYLDPVELLQVEGWLLTIKDPGQLARRVLETVGELRRREISTDWFIHFGPPTKETFEQVEEMVRRARAA